MRAANTVCVFGSVAGWGVVVVEGGERVMLGDKVQLSDADDSQPSYFSAKELGKNTMTVGEQEAPHAHRRY